jgi:outer membrane protein assembly factor BamB
VTGDGAAVHGQHRAMLRRAAVAGAVAVAGAITSACGGSSSGTTSSEAAPPATVAPATTPDRAGEAAGTGDWPTYNRDLTRAGAAPSGPPLGRVRRAWSTDVGSAVYAQPLLVGGKVIVAGENDVVSALRASDGGVLWRTRIGTPVAGGSLPCGNIDPSGITGTPVADPARGVVYVVAFLSGPRHELVAINLGDGAVRWKRGIDAPGADPAVHQQRAALVLSRGKVYVAYGGLFGDCGPYRGTVVAVPASAPTGPLTSYRVPTPRLGGIWAPPGPSVDAAGNLYVATGNGASATSFDYGNAVIRLSPQLRAQAYFAPRDGPSLGATDTDLGSTGPVLLPGGRAFVAGKDSVGYLLDTRRLGGVGHPLATRRVCGGGAFGAIAYARGTLYVPCTEGVVAVRAGGGLRQAWSQTTVDHSPIIAGPGLWGIGGSTLYQLDPRSGRVRFSAAIGTPAHFAAPSAGGGRVLVAAGGRVHAFAGR